MKKIITLNIIALLSSMQLFAQTIPFENLDSASASISRWQKQTDGKNYKDRNGDEYELSFPEENFTVWSYNRLASHAVYKKRGAKEVLALTENIDFKKATGITIADDYEGVVCIKVHFPNEHLKTQIIENGKITATAKADHLEFYCRYGAVNREQELLMDEMFDQLYKLAAYLKIEKGLIKGADVENEAKDWLDLSSEAFLTKYPNSLLSAQAKLIADEERMEKENKLKKNQKYVLELAERYKFKPGLTLSEFAALDKKNKDIAGRKEKVFYDKGNKYASRTNEHFFTVETGPYLILTDYNNIVYYLEYIVEKGSYSKKEAKLYEFVQEIKRNVDKEYIKEFFSVDNPRQLSSVEVKVPGAALRIKADISNTFSLFFEEADVP